MFRNGVDDWCIGEPTRTDRDSSADARDRPRLRPFDGLGMDRRLPPIAAGEIHSSVPTTSRAP